MPKQKFYAIKTPEESKIVMTWAECEKLTHGVKGVLFKSFASRAEAEAWISGMEAPVPTGLRVFVDGSFSPDFPKSGWAFVVTENDVEIARGSGITAFDAESRNIDGEVMASYQAMRWLDSNDKTGTICHDYEGIARWAKGEWQAKSNIAKRYVAAAKPYLHRVSFEKVAAHTGVKWNELVDQLAKDAIARAKKK
ncbi:MAG: ribonuclease H family protein [Fibrobacter sp.]|jgi:ribonuclease HI|uniref:ribonuclease H family protein n=1 Tax=Fibrobacter sp. TaxID=35828 RepID=UPI001AFD6001|nr:ribonuclease H family protein [Fibrobacter sp.]MBO5533466.1 ribonuclease H family protein [Fibrobacter sp.]MDY6264093.1 ribonuclease H family protein [Fibrobacter sp.]MDY6387432.1 ribonuclease H family protein [Fibrobacter sp.]